MLCWIIDNIDRAGGVVTEVDNREEVISSMNGATFVAAPPVSVLLDQQLVETAKTTSDGVNKKDSFLEQTFFSTTCSSNAERLVIFPLDIRIKLATPTSGTHQTPSNDLAVRTY